MAKIHDEKYGEITVRRHARSKQVKLSVAPNGLIHITAPLYTPLAFVRLFLKTSQSEIDTLVEHHTTHYLSDGVVGKSHRLYFYDEGGAYDVSYKKPAIIVRCAPSQRSEVELQRSIRTYVAKALRSEAKAFLPRRLEYLAAEHGYSYSSLRFSHAKGRWGSCSNEGVISLNIALMKLDHHLIDYVLIHELVHTKELNHSTHFWQRVENADPEYKKHKKELKTHSPHI